MALTKNSSRWQRLWRAVGSTFRDPPGCEDKQRALIIPNSVWHNPVHFLAFGLGSGASPIMPGTCGTLVAVPLVVLLTWVLSGASFFWYTLIYGLVVLAVIIIGIYLSHETTKDLKIRDHGGIVIDEIAGYMLAMYFIPISAWSIIVGFVVFRFFDIVKPPPIKQIDRHVGGGAGIMLDDLLAAVYTWLILVILFF